MDNKQNYQPNLTLPPLGGETGPRKEMGNADPTLSAESSPAKINYPDTNTVKPIDFTSLNYAPPVAPLSTPVAPATDITSTDDSKSDIPKEWIAKAKKIIDSTRSDPRTQSLELTKLKADYLKKKFNIDLKIADDE